KSIGYTSSNDRVIGAERNVSRQCVNSNRSNRAPLHRCIAPAGKIESTGVENMGCIKQGCRVTGNRDLNFGNSRFVVIEFPTACSNWRAVRDEVKFGGLGEDSRSISRNRNALPQ